MLPPARHPLRSKKQSKNNSPPAGAGPGTRASRGRRTAARCPRPGRPGSPGAAGPVAGRSGACRRPQPATTASGCCRRRRRPSRSSTRTWRDREREHGPRLPQRRGGSKRSVEVWVRARAGRERKAKRHWARAARRARCALTFLTAAASLPRPSRPPTTPPHRGHGRGGVACVGVCWVGGWVFGWCVFAGGGLSRAHRQRQCVKGEGAVKPSKIIIIKQQGTPYSLSIYTQKTPSRPTNARAPLQAG